MQNGLSTVYDSPRLSVVLTLIRVDQYLSAALASIFEQTYTNFELIIVLDEKCSDQKEMLLNTYGCDPRLRVLVAPSVGGIALALNLGLGASRGKYVARMDGDDISLPDRLEEQVNYLDTHPDTAVVGCRIQIIGPQSEPINRTYPFYESDKKIRQMLPFHMPMAHPTLVFRKKVLLEVQGYKYAHSGEDWELLIRIARNKANKFHNIDKTLFLYRRHGAQGTSFDKVRNVYLECSAFLFGEFMRTFSPKYILGILIKHPIVPSLRRKLRKLRGENSD